MALTKDERQALELARENIRNGAKHGICHQIDRAEELWIISDTEADRLRNYIGDSLDPMRHIGWWSVRWLGKWQEKHLFRHRSEDQLRADRLAWIDWMLGKPLPGEQVEIIWFSKDTVHSTTEYCGREFYAKREVASTNHCVFEKTESRGIVRVCESDDFAKINAAIVAYVWPV